MTTTLPPFVRTSETSRLAALSVYHQRETMADRVLTIIRQHGPVTDERIAELGRMNPSTVRPRRGELLEAGLIRKSDVRGRTNSGRSADQWEAVEREPVQMSLGVA